MGSWWRIRWGLGPVLKDGVGRMSWMKFGGPVGAGVGILFGSVNGIAGWIASLRFFWLVSWRLVGLPVGQYDVGWEVSYVGCNRSQQLSYHLCHRHRQELGMDYCFAFVVGGLMAVVVRQ